VERAVLLAIDVILPPLRCIKADGRDVGGADMAEPVRLVIWDLDETFWRGTHTEGGMTWRDDCEEIVIALARRGIMNSICSKNDFETVRALLMQRGVWDYFIFPSIDWSAKGARIKEIVEAVQLRPQSVMFIDDNHLNLEEAKFFAPGIQVASDAIIPSMLSDPSFAGKDDRTLTRLNQYKVLERRKADEARECAIAGGDNLAFLRGSDIRVRIDNDVEAHLDRAIELINRTNQLNFIKRRLPEDGEEAREKLRAELTNLSIQAGLIEVSDKYGDYGYCGYYQIATARDVTVLRQFCFSCRILGMGIEAWMYQRLGRPVLNVRGDVLSDPITHADVDWVRLVDAQALRGDGAVAEDTSLGSVAARGGCNLWPLAHYFRLSSPRVVSEFNTVRDGKLILLDHSLCLRHAILGVTNEQIDAIAPLGYLADDFKSDLFEYVGQLPLWVFSNWVDIGARLFRHNRTGIVIPYSRRKLQHHPVADRADETYLKTDFSLIEYDEIDFKQTLSLIFSKIPQHGIMFVLLIPECTRRDGEYVTIDLRKRFNRWVTEAAALYHNVRLLDMSDFIRDETEVMNDARTHYHRNVYHRLYLHIREQAKLESAEALVS
jgi:FkbH-like protein